ncbi:hypothetical protein HNV11_09575 [Spirosoma taeanense]|uniref:Uncharacterized protein n=1 Tax=Spirosoma taeanense TaxID=2735870 RepID=A0A6M5Y800_9BACT|nr:hypothetical protein [Spirosoma taeanense]QJW89614.1 hypothetical protein HNV11_09575 [Spirosoma taeanense]
MDESKFLETLFERYLSNQATDEELEVFMDLLRQGKLDDLAKSYLDREAEATDSSCEFSNVGLFRPWMQWLRIAASIALILW